MVLMRLNYGIITDTASPGWDFSPDSLLICYYHVAVLLLPACSGQQADSKKTARREQENSKNSLLQLIGINCHDG